MGGFFSQAWYQVSYSFAAWALQDMYSFITFEAVGSNCLTVLSFLPNEKAQKICSQITDPAEYQQFYRLVEPCIDASTAQTFKANFSLTRLEMGDYCDMDDEPSNLGALALTAAKNLSDWYGCYESLPVRKCTEKDFITKQLFVSGITQRPYRNYPRSATETAHEWNS